MMNRYRPIKLIVLAIFSTLVMSCASSSKEIAAAYVSPSQYTSFNCDQLSQELERLNRRKTALAADLDKKASSDEGLTAVSAILFWPAAFALGGNQAQEAEYARMKGEYDAVQQAGIEKNCKLNYSTSLQTARVTIQSTSGKTVSAIDFYGQAEEEVNAKTYDKNIWAKAFVDAEGDETKRKAKYIELRAQQLYLESGVATAGTNPTPEKSTSDDVPEYDVSGNYVSEITTNSHWQFLKKYKKLKITVTQSGKTINAIDNRYQTKIEGTLEGDVIKFHVNPNVVSGFYDAEGEWKLKTDRTGFDGKWRSLGGADAGSGVWNLKKE